MAKGQFAVVAKIPSPLIGMPSANCRSSAHKCIKNRITPKTKNGLPMELKIMRMHLLVYHTTLKVDRLRFRI